MSDPHLWINGEGDVVHPNAPAGGGGPGHFASAAPLGNGVDLGVPHPFSPVGHNLVLNEQHQLQLSEGETPDAGGTDEIPVFNSTTPIPVSVTADTVEDFVRNVNAALGGTGEAGHMASSAEYNLELDSKGRVTKVNMVVKTQIVRPRWSGGRANDSQRALIKQAEDLIKTHEERHRDIAKDFFTRACKAMRGKTAAKAEETIKQFIQKLDKAQEEFDAREGMLIVEFNGPNGNAGPSTGVRTGPLKKP